VNPPALEPGPSLPRARRIRTIAGFALGVLLLVAAGWAVVSQGAALEQTREAIRGASVWLIVGALLLPVLNWLVISASFWIMMRRYGRIGYREMAWLIGAAWLLNYLPLRAGMIGRIAYHKTVNNIRVADSLRVTVYGLIFGGVSLLILLLAAAVLAARGPWPLWAGILSVPALLAATAALVIASRGSSAWWLPAAFGFRYLDTMIWTLRYAVVFALVGATIDFSGAVIISAVSQAAILVPIVPNGLGLREWAVGLTAAALPPSLVTAEGQVMTAIGMAADLANRAAELLVAIPVGLLATWHLARRSASRPRPPQPATPVL
jgi:hypothetical protein